MLSFPPLQMYLSFLEKLSTVEEEHITFLNTRTKKLLWNLSTEKHEPYKVLLPSCLQLHWETSVELTSQAQ